MFFLSDYHQWPTASRTHFSLVISFGIVLCRDTDWGRCVKQIKNKNKKKGKEKQDAIICKCVCRQRFYKVLYSWYIHLLPINLFACVMWCYFWAIHNTPSLLLPPSYGTGNGMWTPIPVLNEARAKWKGTCPAIACANNLFHFCSATYNKTLFLLCLQSTLHLCVRGSVEKSESMYEHMSALGNMWAQQHEATALSWHVNAL